MLRIGVLASHEGTTLQSIIDACVQGRINGRVVVVISNNSGSGALRRAAASGIETFHLSSMTHSSGDSLDAAICTALQRMRSVMPPGTAPDLRHQDYRLLPAEERWDAMASVGMMEHVGRAHLDLYFASLVRHLAPGGLLLNHAIAETGSVEKTIPWLTRTHGGFIRQEIFPDSDLPPLDLVIGAAQRAGFEVLDVEAFRSFYVRTLLEWLGRLERRFTEAVQLVGKRRARAWRLYFASTAVTFKSGRTTVAQVLLQKREGGAPRVLDKPRWYRELVDRG